jgi:hypothetical protein
MRFLAILGLSAAVAVVSGHAHAGLVAYWSFDNDFAADAGGSDFDLSPVNGATAGTAGGIFGSAASFSRASSQYAFTSGNVLQVNQDFSYSAWYRTSIDEEVGIVGGDRYFVLETTAANVVSATEAWTASIGLRDIGGVDLVEVFTSPSLSVGTTPTSLSDWQNVIVTFDADGGTAGTGLMNAYLNGNLFATRDNLAPRTAVEGLVIGGHRAGTGRNFQGLIDAVSFYDHVLSAGEISTLQRQAVVPEPTSLALAGIALAAIVAWRKR